MGRDSGCEDGIIRLEIRPTSENCGAQLLPNSLEAMICSFECTFCRTCVDVFVRDPKEESYGMVTVFKDLYGNQWDLLQPRHLP